MTRAHALAPSDHSSISPIPTGAGGHALSESASFHATFVALFNAQFPRIFRLLDRLTGEPDLAEDLAQETFIRLHRRGGLPDDPDAWLATVALNLFRNARSSARRRRELLTVERGAQVHSEAVATPDDRDDSEIIRARVRRALDALSERERQLLLLRAEGYSYQDISTALDLNAASVGVLLARAKQRFRTMYEEVLRAH